MAGRKKVFVVGVGMTKFEKPGRREDFDYPEMAKEAVTNAMKDAGVKYSDVEQVTVGYCYGDSTCGQRAVYQLGLSGVPIYNVNNACATGSTALILAKQLVEGGTSDCILALGFEKMERGSLGSKFTDRTNPMDKHVPVFSNKYGISASPITPQMFASAGRDHMKKYGTKEEHFAKIAYKNHLHSTNNPKSQFQKEYSLEQIKNSPMIAFPLTKLQCCEAFVKARGLEGQAVQILAMEMATDLPTTFKEEAEDSCMKMVGYDMAKKAAEAVYKKAGLAPRDVDVVELHDCFSANELISYEALGLCAPGKAGEMVDRGDNTYGGKYVVNPSGGLISKGHPLGATGLAQCTELCLQLRGQADRRQVPGAKVALQHNIGLGGAAVVALYRLGFPASASGPVATRRAMSGSGLKCEPIFGLIADNIKNEGEKLVKKIKGSFLFKVKGDNGETAEWLIDLKSGKGSITKNPGKKGDCTISMKDSDFMDMVSGKLGAQKAFFEGKLKIAGNTAMAMKLQAVVPTPGKAKV